MQFRTFKTIVHGVAANLSAEVSELWEASITPNFHSAQLRTTNSEIYLLCSVEGFWACSSVREKDSCELSFVDNSDVQTALRSLFGIELLTKRQLGVRFRRLPSTSDADISYWKPKTMGDGVFNWWD